MAYGGAWQNSANGMFRNPAPARLPVWPQVCEMCVCSTVFIGRQGQDRRTEMFVACLTHIDNELCGGRPINVDPLLPFTNRKFGIEDVMPVLFLRGKFAAMRVSPVRFIFRQQRRHMRASCVMWSYPDS